MEQAVNLDGALSKALAELQATLSGQTTMIYVLIAIAALSLIIALAALSRGKGRSPQAAPAAAAPQGQPLAASRDDGALVAAITAAIACLLEQEGGERPGARDFVVRRIRRV